MLYLIAEGATVTSHVILCSSVWYEFGIMAACWLLEAVVSIVGLKGGANENTRFYQ